MHQALVMRSFNPSTHEVEVGESEFEASLVNSVFQDSHRDTGKLCLGKNKIKT